MAVLNYEDIPKISQRIPKSGKEQTTPQKMIIKRKIIIQWFLCYERNDISFLRFKISLRAWKISYPFNDYTWRGMA